MPRPLPLLPLLGSLSLAAGCTAYAVRDADQEMAEILEEVERDHIAARVPGLVQPERAPLPESQPESAPAESEPASEPAPHPEALRLGLRDAMQLAVRQSRDYRTQFESLQLQALSLSGTRRNFSPRFTGILSYLYSQGFRFPEGAFSPHISGDPVHSGSASLGVSQIMPLGGTLELNAEETAARNTGLDDPSYAGTVTASYSQNLLRGVGYEASHEALVQGERSMVYAARDFELFRQDFSIDVARRFYNLVAQQRVLENTRARRRAAARTLAQSEALHRVGQLNRVDLYRAQQGDLDGQNQLLQAEQSFEDALDQFKIFLGLTTETRLEIEPEEPTFVPVSLDLLSAIAAAESNRLDFKTSQDELEDAQRAVRIAAQGLNADLNFDVDGRLATGSAASFDGQRFRDSSVTAGLSLGLPLDRKAERNAYRSALISLDRARRSYDLARDNLALEVRRNLRDLQRVRTTLDIQRKKIETEERTVRITTIQFRAGNVPNRDLVEAEQGLLDARNAEIQDRVDYEIARLQLRRILGTLVLEPEGLWVEKD
ncbi:MAG TPA: TolC family protein [Planctomycetota bacterium]|nr:TolC family protein [Planctomycetota bacterium]